MIRRRRSEYGRGVGALRMCALVLCLFGSGCTSSTGDSTPGSLPPVSTAVPPTGNNGSTQPNVTPASAPTFVDTNGFNDHTVPNVETRSQLLALAKTDSTGRSVVKFTFTEPMEPRGGMHLYDSNFYKLHDEWYWFRLLNGQAVVGSSEQPITGEQFLTIDSIYAWAKAKNYQDLPLNLAYVDDRIGSSSFYRAALFEPVRRFGVGSLVRFVSTPTESADKPTGGEVGEQWLIELEYQDIPTPKLIEQYFTRLLPAIPADIRPKVRWVVRSPEQQAVAKTMTNGELPFHDRIVTYSELIKTGTTEIYSEGVSVGRLRYVGPDDDDGTIGRLLPDDILITERVPDWLPPARAVITSDPQTPLAHINLLARNRGIPNLSQAGIHLNAAVRRAAEVRARALVIAEGRTFKLVLLDEAEYDGVSPRPQFGGDAIRVPSVDTTSLPLTFDLRTLADEVGRNGVSEAELDRWRPALGGKSVGFLVLYSTPALTPPPDALAITVKPYLHHIEPLRPLIEAAITNPTVLFDVRARWLALEGPDEYRTRFALETDETFAQQLRADFPIGTPLGDVLAAGGVRKLVRDQAIEPAVLRDLTNAIQEQFGNYDKSVGLRFRSSSSVEDIEGFNGAGLYVSQTGFLYPEAQNTDTDRNDTVQRAIQDVWSSYWSVEAFDERTLYGVDHLSGAMGIVVHARFDDDLETNNGVATLTFLRGGDLTDAVLTVNVQAGSTAVTNPETGSAQTPEVVQVQRRSGQRSITRFARSSLSPNRDVMSDAALQTLWEQAVALGTTWRTALNTGVRPEQHLQGTAIDIEFKTVASGWPRRRDGDPAPARLVIRQVRSLDPGLGHLAASDRDLSAPRDLLMRASRVTEYICNNGQARYVEMRIDPLRNDIAYPEAGWTDVPPNTNLSACAPRAVFVSPKEAMRALGGAPDALIIAAATGAANASNPTASSSKK
jgi:hypothetical protein